jgi:predicted GIY-YIG superfamily endonuclease/ribosomal protein S27E
MSTPHVLYRFFNAQDELLYIGITKNPWHRFKSHQNQKAWFRDVAKSTMEHFPSRRELITAEIRAIQTENPKYNRAHALETAVEPARKAARNRRSSPIYPDASRFHTSVSDRDIRDPAQYELLTVPCPQCNQLAVYTNADGTKVMCTECATGPLSKPMSQLDFARAVAASIGRI